MIDVSTMTEQERNQLLVNAISDYAIYMLDAAGQVASWSPGAQRFKGYSVNEVLGEPFELFFTDEDRAADAPGRALRIAARDGRYETEGWRVRKDGSRFWAHAVVDAIRNEEGELIGFAEVERDITEKKSAETQLRQSEERFRLLIQGVKDCAIYMLDPTGHVTNWNAGAAKIKGYTSNEIVGQHFSRFYTEPDRAAGEPERALKTALSEGKYEREAWRVRKDGGLFWAHVLIDPIHDDEGHHIGFAKVTRDMSEKKKADQEIAEAQYSLLQSQKLQAIGELTGGIAHDFNNMLTVIAGSADFLRRNRDVAEEKKVRYLDGILETTDRATRLTSQLLAFARQQPLMPRVFYVVERLEAIGELLRRTLGSQIQVTTEGSDKSLRVEVDPAQLEAALLNAAVNARDAMPEGGQITLMACQESIGRETFVRVSITDTGNGMPDDVRQRAFDPFFTTKEIGKGTGLGLSQVHGFAAQAGGFAEIDTSEGTGTTLSLVLPLSLKEAEEQEVDRKDDSADRPDLRAHVLLVEDNERVRGFAEDILRDMGCEVTAASNGKLALEMLEEVEVDVVISDIVMPEMSGIELAARIVNRWPRLPIVLATGYSNELAVGSTAHPVVLKPFTSSELYDAVRTALAS